MDNRVDNINLIREVMLAVVEAVKASEPVGMPSGHLYAALMPGVITYDGYIRLTSGMESAGVIKAVGYVYHVTKLGEEFIAASQRIKASSVA